MKNGKTFPKEGKLHDVMGMFLEPIKVEKIEYPIEEIERLVALIISLNKEVERDNDTTNISSTIDILNESLKLLIKPSLIMVNDEKA